MKVPNFLEPSLTGEIDLTKLIADIRVRLSKKVRLDHLGSCSEALAEGYAFVKQLEDLRDVLSNNLKPSVDDVNQQEC